MLITGELQKQAWVDCAMPPAERVRDDIWSIPVDFSGSPVRYTFAYLLTNAAGECILIDPGFDSEFGRSQILAGLAAASRSMASIVGIVSTHLHPDHLGMVEWVAERSHAWIGMHPREQALLALYDDPKAALALDDSWIAEIGVPDDRRGEISTTNETLVYMKGLARATVLLDDNEVLQFEGRRLRVVATPGHTPGHICIVDEDNRVAFTGDHILPRITPNVGLTSTGTRVRALADYYASLERMKTWDGCEVLPAHEYRFRGLADRAGDLAQHHRDRAEEIIFALAGTEGETVYEVAKQITWSRGWDSLHGINLRAALSETEAHVDFLLETGEVELVGDGLPRILKVGGAA